MRRLNQREYRNTIEQLTGAKVDVGSLPTDGGSGTFDTVGASQFISSVHVGVASIVSVPLSKKNRTDTTASKETKESISLRILTRFDRHQQFVRSAADFD